MNGHIINIGYMKQQEILRKIGNILKELNEQYEYLHAEETHLNDLELELFAANAKFLTDHTEILRKINAQSIHITPALPEHTDSGASKTESSFIEILPPTPAPENEVSLPPLAQSAITFNTDDTLHETINLPAGQYTEEDSTIAVNDETEPYFTPNVLVEPHMEEPQEGDQQYSFEEPVEENAEPQFQESHSADLTEEGEHAAVQNYTFVETQPTTEEETRQDAGIAINTHENDSYDFIRRDPEGSDNDHSFSISSHTDEPAPPHIDLTSVTETTEQEPTLTTEPPAYAEPVNIVPEEPEPIIQTPRQEDAAYSTPKPIDTGYETQQPTPIYTSPAAEISKPEPEQPLTLNQRLSAQLHPQTPAYTQQGAPVTDIKAAISINDKLLFVKDLFNGYGMAYGEAIELLNRCKTFDEADRFLKSNYVVKNSWGDKPNTVDKFYAVLHRRFTE